MSPFGTALLGYMLYVLVAFVALLRFRPRPARPQPKGVTGVLSTDDELYDAFRRHDQYGLLGAQPQPLREYLRLAILLTTLAPLKAFIAFSCVFAVHLQCRCPPDIHQWVASLCPLASVIVEEVLINMLQGGVLDAAKGDAGENHSHRRQVSVPGVPVRPGVHQRGVDH